VGPFRHCVRSALSIIQGTLGLFKSLLIAKELLFRVDNFWFSKLLPFLPLLETICAFLESAL
jgi:hypothetical protein